MNITIIVPTWNEITGMRKIMPLIKREWYQQLIVVDAGSNDGTLEYARSQGYECFVQKNPGLHNAYREIYSQVTGDIVIFFSPDGNSIPELIPELTKKMREGHDMVIASRYAPGAKSDDDDTLTAFGNWLFTKMINIFYRAQYTDAMVMYRAIRKNLVYELGLDKESTYWPENIFRTKICWMPILSIRAAKQRKKIAEIPGDEPVRIGGIRKLQVWKWGAAYLTQVITEKFLWR